MKCHFLNIGLLALMVMSCNVEEMFDPEAERIKPGEDVFYATIEGQDTKTYANENQYVVWNNDDHVTIFNKRTTGYEYSFQGESGSSEGPFINVDEVVDTEEEVFAKIIAVYPHSVSTEINADESISMSLPSKQYYQAHSFGRGACAMVSVSENRTLKFRNVNGFFSFKFYGENVSVASVILRGNNDEPLAGPCKVTMPVNGLPSVTMDEENAVKSVKLYCKDAVQLESTSDKYTEFWFALPPMTFEGGFTVTVMTDDGRKFEKSSTTRITIDRNTIQRMAPLEVVPNTSETVGINSLSTIFGKTDETATSDDKSYVAEKKDRTFTFTIPTWTASYGLKLNAEIDGDSLSADGEVITANNQIDVSKDVTLAACKGDFEMRYTLKVRNTGLPVVRIKTPKDYFTMKDIEDDENHVDWRPSDTELAANVPLAEIRVENADGTKGLIKYKKTGEIEYKYKVNTQVKGRGNATWTYDKRPYALKFEDKMQVFDMPPSKRWILLANWKDRTLLRNDAAFWLSQQISDVIQSPSFPYTVHGQFVELEFNGVHRGNYYLCEQIKIEENRLNITKVEDEDIPSIVTGPFLMEIDNNYDEQFKFISGFYGKTTTSHHNTTFTPYGMKYMFKFPDENLSNTAEEYMTNYIKAMEELIKAIPSTDYKNNTGENFGYRGYLDMDSAIWFMFVNELTGNGDFFNTDSSDESSQWYGPHSTYFYKDVDSKLFMGPVWDFDYKTFISTLTTVTHNWWGEQTTEDNRSKRWVGADNPNYYYYYLCKDPEFKARMEYLWYGDEGRENGYTHMIKTAFGEYIDQMAEYIRLSETFNKEMWGYVGGKDQNQNGDNTLEQFQDAVDLMKTAFIEKRDFMDKNLKSLNQ